MKDRWEHLEHDADIGVRGLAMTKAGAFERAGLARQVARLSPLICIKG